ATQQRGNAATQQRGNAATQQRGNAATQQRSNAATRQRGNLDGRPTNLQIDCRVSLAMTALTIAFRVGMNRQKHNIIAFVE
ncbi:MAG: hypothetical protein KAG66_10470, partial [Methylococcales bacterium]|nr:hypothetical protein [Methylococcales bacterium]